MFFTKKINWIELSLKIYKQLVYITYKKYIN